MQQYSTTYTSHYRHDHIDLIRPQQSPTPPPCDLVISIRSSPIRLCPRGGASDLSFQPTHPPPCVRTPSYAASPITPLCLMILRSGSYFMLTALTYTDTYTHIHTQPCTSEAREEEGLGVQGVGYEVTEKMCEVAIYNSSEPLGRIKHC